MEIKVIKNVDIDELDFSVRTWNCLRRGMINTVQDIADNYHNLNRVRNLGQKCYDEIMEKIKPYVEFVDKICITNYDRIKSMSVEEMAEMLIEETEAPLSGEPFLITPDGELFNEYEEQAKNKAILHTIQWLFQKSALDLINRQKAEIERLQNIKKHIDTLVYRDRIPITAETYNMDFQHVLEKLYDSINMRNEAIKEFVERANEKADNVRNFNSWQSVVSIDNINNIAKEMGYDPYTDTFIKREVSK